MSSASFTTSPISTGECLAAILFWLMSRRVAEALSGGERRMFESWGRA